MNGKHTNTQLNTASGDKMELVICYHCHWQMRLACKFNNLVRQCNRNLQELQQNPETNSIFTTPSLEIICSLRVGPTEHTSVNIRSNTRRSSQLEQVVVDEETTEYDEVHVELNTVPGDEIDITCHVCRRKMKRSFKYPNIVHRCNSRVLQDFMQNTETNTMTAPSLIVLHCLRMAPIQHISVNIRSKSKTTHTSQLQQVVVEEEETPEYEEIHDEEPNTMPSTPSLERLRVLTVGPIQRISLNRFNTTSTSQLEQPVVIEEETHSKVKPFLCKMCDKSYTLKSNLTKHMIIHKKKKSCKYSCKCCYKVFYQKVKLSKHMKTHTKKMSYSCKYCDKVFYLKVQLTKHIKTHTGTGKNKFSIDICSNTRSTSQLEQPVVIEEETHSKMKPFLCKMCDKSYTLKSNLTRHMIIHKKKKSCKYSCKYCYRVFYQKVKLSKHVKTHTGTGKNKFSTNICSNTKSTSQLEQTVVIEKETLSKMKPFLCKMCDMSYTLKSNLTRHMIIHKKKKSCKYSCKCCYRVFYQKVHLSKHMKIHTKKKSYSCKCCHKVFYLKVQLTKHMKTHTGTGKNKFSTNICSNTKSTSQLEQAVVIEEETHSKMKPFLCKMCDKSYTLKSNLTRHMIIHTKKKPCKYSCKCCHKVLYQKVQLTKHMKTHTKNKSYSCNCCDKVFYLKVQLTKHMITHTGPGKIKFPSKSSNKAFAHKITLRSHMQKRTRKKYSCKMCCN